MDSSILVKKANKLLKNLYLAEKIDRHDFHQLVNLISEIQLKSNSEWVMNKIVYPEAFSVTHRPG